MSLNEQTQAIATAAKSAIKIDQKTGLPEVNSELWAKSFEGADVTREQYIAAKRHLENFVAGTVSGAGEMMVDAYKGNKDLTELKLTIPLEGKDKLLAVQAAYPGAQLRFIDDDSGAVHALSAPHG